MTFETDLQLPQAPPLNQHDEAVLYARLRSGDRAAANELLERSAKILLRICTRRIKAPLREDAFQAGCLAVLTRIDEWDPTLGRWNTWAGFIARNGVSRFIENQIARHDGSDPRVRHGRTVSLSGLDSDRSAADHFTDTTTENPLAAAIRLDDVRRLREIVTRLPARERAVLEHRFRDDQVLREIGEELGISAERVRQIEERGKSIIAKNWQRQRRGTQRMKPMRATPGGFCHPRLVA